MLYIYPPGPCGLTFHEYNRGGGPTGTTPITSGSKHVIFLYTSIDELRRVIILPEVSPNK